MVGLSPQGEVQVLNSILSPNAYISLHTADPGNTGANEISTDPTYSRQVVTNWTVFGSNPTQYSNTDAIVWGVAGADWGTVTHFGVWTNQVGAPGATYYGSGQLSTALPINANDVARFVTGALVFLAD